MSALDRLPNKVLAELVVLLHVFPEIEAPPMQEFLAKYRDDPTVGPLLDMTFILREAEIQRRIKEFGSLLKQETRDTTAINAFLSLYDETTEEGKLARLIYH